jgi:hypothetical protein
MVLTDPFLASEDALRAEEQNDDEDDECANILQV